MAMEIKTFGPVDERSLRQLETCMAAGDAELGVLCADHHPGYSQPIGGGIAYEGYISPTGVGFDIACLAAGTPVTTADGHYLPIEHIWSSDPILCWDGHVVRRVEGGCVGLERGVRPTLRLSLTNGRSLLATSDHPIRVRGGWREAGDLDPGDLIACSPFLGLPYEPPAGTVELPDLRKPEGRMVKARRQELLESLGLWPLEASDPRFPPLVRLLAYVCGDGHLDRAGNRVCFYTTSTADAETIAGDIRALGFTPRRATRSRGTRRKDEICIYVGSVALHALLEAMGSPVGSKSWPAAPMPWLFNQPAWLRAQFLSSFASAEMSTPLLIQNRLVNLAIKQAGESSNAIHFVAQLFATLGFRTSISLSGPARGERQTYVVQILGGEAEQLRFIEEVGFCYARQKRVAAAEAASIVWQHMSALGQRERLTGEAKALRAAGHRYGAVVDHLRQRFSISENLAHHAFYDERGPRRRPRGTSYAPQSDGEMAWVAVQDVTDGPPTPVYDLATSDPAHCFFASGLVAHNCGNKAVKTDISRADLEAGPGVEAVMREITRRISFGMGVPAQEVVDHPVLDHIARASFEPQRKMLKLARSQLGTVGSGNHYVNLFEDESGTVWVGVHFGSRGFGHKTASGFLAMAQGLPFDEGERKRLGLKVREGGMDSPPVLFEIDSEVGRSYIEAMHLAGEYAYAGRDVVVGKVLEILGATATHEVHNHHNFAWREEHFGRAVWVVRKGCTPARPGQEGFVGASMGDESVILEGAPAPEAEQALYSTVHGAGRVMSRSQAAGRVRRRTVYACGERDCDFRVPAKGYRGQTCPRHPRAKMRKVRAEEVVRPGVVDWPAVQRRLRQRGIVLVGGGADEAPEVYKRLPEVLAAHGDSIRVKHRLRPLGVAMAGRDVFDPYKD